MPTYNFTVNVSQGQYLKLYNASDAIGTGKTEQQSYLIPTVNVVSVDFTSQQAPIYDFTGSTFDGSSTNSTYVIEARLGSTVVETLEVTSATGTATFLTPSIAYDNLRIYGKDDIFTVGAPSDAPVVPYIVVSPPAFNVIRLPFSDRAYAVSPTQIHDEYTDVDPAFDKNAWRSTVQPIQGTANAGPFVSQGGNVPDDIMFWTIGRNETGQRVANSSFLKVSMGVPWKDPANSNVYWGVPGVFSSSNPTGTGTLIGTNNQGPFRQHFSFRYNLNDAEIRLKDGTNFNTHYSPVKGYTPEGVIRYDFITVSPRDEGTDYNWPGITAAGSPDDPSYGINIFQTKGRHSAVVPFNMKWGGRYMHAVFNQLYGGSVPRVQIINPSTPNTGGLGVEGLKDKWIDFIIKVRSGRDSQAATLGYQPGYDIYYRFPHIGSAWTLAHSVDCDVVSGLQNASWQATYGIDPNYIGLTNLGMYPSGRISGSFALDKWRNWHDATTTKYLTMWFGETATVYFDDHNDDPGFAAVAAAIDTEFGF